MPRRDNLLLSFFIPDLTVGGAEQVTVNIVNGLSDRGYNVELLLSRFEGELRSQLNSHVKTVILPPKRTSVFGVAARFPAIHRYLRQKKPDALFPHLEHPSVVCLAVDRVFNTDTLVIPTQHSAFGVSTDDTPKDRIVRRLVPRLYPTADHIIAVSEGVANSITERTTVRREDISVLKNPIDIAKVQERAREPGEHEWIEDSDVDVILFVGRLAHQKDLDTWLRAFKIVHERRPETRGVIVGKGPQRRDVLALIERLGLEEVVSMPGFVENPYRYMQQAAVFLLSSRYEGLPTVLVEALACGCPIVSTDCPSGPREILADGAFGHLVPIGKHAELADAAIKAMAHPPSSKELHKRAQDFSPDSVFDEYERFIEDHVISN